MVLVLSALTLTLSASLVAAQSQNSTYTSGFIQALNNAGLTTLASAIGSLNSTGAGSELLGKLSNQTQNYTVFAPNNDAFNNIPGGGNQDPTQDPTFLVDTVAYHIVFGHFSNVTDYPNTTIGRTTLGDPSVVMLEGNKNQVVAWSRRADGVVHVLNQNKTNDPRVVQLTGYQNLDIYVIDGVLFYPANVTDTFDANSQLTGFSDLARSTQVPIWNTGTNSTEETSVSNVLTGVRGLTLFAPNNQASTQFQQFSDNNTALWDVLRNHIINGTTVYSPSLVNTKYTSAGGEDFQFSSNSSGKYVTSGNTTARIVQPDVLTTNGVIHIIDAVLLNQNVDQNAANNAASSASSLAGHSSTETGPVGVPTGSTSNNNSGATGNFKAVNSFGVVVLSVVLGSCFLFA